MRQPKGVITASGLLVAMPGARHIAEIMTKLAEVREAGIAANVGVSYYTHSLEVHILKVDQNAYSVMAVVNCVGTFLKIVSPGSMLAQSPVFQYSTEEAKIKS